ncbi:cytochrome c3 family protein [Tropicimonas sediminicola]|uniref:Cytochrome c7 n=1 Tax=Tropicimonas sediminicola TaxID=1031541 RepID=A0A239LMR5_9RHOB|nr:cytochrome c3 family protein [Tropicimonas sediminicola]SNT31771.1 Cytochrome c7 [Tropicimonas sediminicola]
MKNALRGKMLALVLVGATALGWTTSSTSVHAQDSGAAATFNPADLMPEIPALEAWRNSPHADLSKEAFRHWDEEEDKLIPETCAKCHSTTGYLEFLGADGSEPGVVSKQEIDPEHASGIACMACHNTVAQNMTSVIFPSGDEAEVFTSDIRCMTCHGGRASTVQVNDKMEELGNPESDSVAADLAFINIHYRPAAATRFGGEVRGGYEYDGMEYAGYYFHDRDSQTCNDCHSPHSLEVKVESCTDCHDEVDAANAETMRLVRSSKADYDANGDTSEGIHAEIAALHGQLYDAISSYADAVLGQPVIFRGTNYPYFFNDTNGNGEADDDEVAFPNRYQSWSPRLLKAAYNYNFISKDPGGYTHNPYYQLQLAYDSIADLAEGGSGVEVMGERPDE